MKTILCRVSAPGRHARTVEAQGTNTGAIAKQIANAIRAVARKAGVSPLAVDYEIVTEVVL